MGYLDDRLSTICGTEHGRTVQPSGPDDPPLGTDSPRLDQIRRIKLQSPCMFIPLNSRDFFGGRLGTGSNLPLIIMYLRGTTY
jgi:hypothetical protein